MKASEIQTGATYGIAIASRKGEEHTWFEHAEVLIANVRSYDELEEAGYIATRPSPRRYGGYDREHAEAEDARVQAAKAAGKVVLDTDQLTNALRKAADEYKPQQFKPLHLVRIIAQTTARHLTVDTKLVEPARLQLVGARELAGTAAELMERAEAAVASNVSSAQRRAVEAEQQAQIDADINQLLADHGIDVDTARLQRSGSGERRTVSLTLAQLRQLAGE
jgi:hypothetical protein